ncbi:MAG: helix-turn-helix domain-containing protein [Roseburia sp.]|nr:helix-turn-helix domain-containing protein [Roseburia sp.]
MKNHNQKHLTLSDRFYIEQEIQQGHSFSSIAKTLNKDPSTISKEVKRNRIYCSPDRFQSRYKSCVNYADCKEHHVCGNGNCNSVCRQCRGKNPISYCIHFQP